MPLTSVLKTTVNPQNPLDASGATDPEKSVSDFLTVQSLTNFAAMTGAITAGWKVLRTISSYWFSSAWVPFVFALVWATLSVVISLEGLKKDSSHNRGNIGSAIFIAFINSLVLTSAVLGTDSSTPGGS